MKNEEEIFMEELRKIKIANKNSEDFSKEFATMIINKLLKDLK
jgi:hypothetical protein